MEPNPSTVLKFLNLALNSQFYVHYYKTSQLIVVQEVYKIHLGDNAGVIQTVGSWSPLSNLIMTITNFWQRRGNLNGKMIFGATIAVNRHLKDFLNKFC